MSGNGNVCSYINCEIRKATSNISLFRFPVGNSKRCIEWIINSGRDEFSELTNHQLKSKYICSKHFKDSSFTNHLKNRLLKNNPLVIPIPYIDEESSKTPLTENERHLKKDIIENNRILDINETLTVENIGGHLTTLSTVLQAQSEHGESLEDFNADFQPLPDSHGKVKNTNSRPCKILDSSSYTPRKIKLLKTVSRQKSLLKHRLNKLSFSKKQSLQRRIGLQSILDHLPKFIGGEPLIFVQMQLKHQSKAEWSKEEKNISLSIYYKSPSTYRHLLDRGYKLPCLRLIQSWINIHNVQPGFSNEVFSKLRMKANAMTPEERQCVLMFDEMSIKKSLEYNAKFDLVEGFEDLGPLGRSDLVATHALVMMIRGLKKAWKFPIAYFLANNSVKASSLAVLLDMGIAKIFEASFDLKVIVSDLGSNNAAALKMLGVSKENPHYFYGNNKIYVLCDFPHLLKCIRNNLLKHDFIVNDEVVSWKAIREFYELEKQSTSDCRAAPKLSERHIQPPPFLKMSVKIAAQVFSGSVSRGMKAAELLGLLKDPACLSTANFIGKVNDLTDCMNSKNLNDKNPLKRPLSKKNTAPLNCLKESVEFIKSWKVVGANAPPTFEGLIQTISGVLALYDDLVTDDLGFLMTGRLNQDSLENQFGVLRRRSGYNSNPSSKELRRNLQHSVSIRLMNPSPSANCEPDGDDMLDVGLKPHQGEEEEEAGDEEDTCSKENKTSYLKKTCNSNDTLHTAAFVDALRASMLFSHEDSFDPSLIDTMPSTSNQLKENINAVSTLTALEDNVIFYISGWLVKKSIDKFGCVKCERDLTKNEKGFNLKREQLTYVKTFTKHDGSLADLKKPNDKFYHIVQTQVATFAKWFPQLCSKASLGRKLGSEIKTETEQLDSEWWSTECGPHRAYMLDMLIKCKLSYSLKWKSDELRDHSLLKRKETGKANAKMKKLKHM